MEAPTQLPALEASTILERVARIISSGHEWRGTKPDYTRLAAELEPAIPFDVFGVVLLRHDRQAVRINVCSRASDGWVADYHQHPLEESRVQRLLEDPVMGVQNYPAGLDGPPAQSGDALSGFPQLRSTLIAPLIFGDRILGTLELGSSMLNTYDDENLQRLIKAVVDVLAAAIESAQTGGNVDIQNRQRQALKDVTSALTSAMDLSTILERIVTGVADALQVASAIVTFVRGELRLQLAAQSGMDAEILRQLISSDSVLTEQCIIGYTLQRRQPIVSQNIATDERFPASRLFATMLKMHTIFSYPLVSGTTVYGTLLLCSPEPGGFTPLKTDIFSLFASQATIAIHNGLLLEAAERRRRFQEAIQQLEQARVQNGDERDLLEHVRTETERTFGVSFGTVLQFISDHLLTRNERDLQLFLQAAQEEQHAETAPLHFARQASGPAERSLEWLMQTTNATMARADMLSELSRLLQLYERSTGDSTDAWFVTDLEGRCLYMNPAAEVFCGIRLLNVWNDSASASSTLEDIFATVLPRIRNIDEVSAYLRDFASSPASDNGATLSEAQATQRRSFTNESIRCVLAGELIKKSKARNHGDASLQARESDTKRKTSSRSTTEPSTSTAKETGEYAADHYYQLTRHPFYNRDGQLIAHALQVHDITEQVRDEKNRSALLSSVSHDLRTPLTTIKAAITGLLQPGVTWDEQTRQEILEDVDKETDHLTVLVNALVEMSRIEMGALVLEKEWCDVVEIIYSTLNRIGRNLMGRHVRLDTPERLLPLIQADYAQLERVFYNLLENAAQRAAFMEEQHLPNGKRGKSEIVVAFDIVDADGEGEFTSPTETRKRLLRVQVIDHGPQVPEEERESIFKSFFTRGSAIGGGLGLAICRGIIEAHQGQIWVESTPEQTCFVFTLPVHAFTPSRNSGGEFR